MDAVRRKGGQNFPEPFLALGKLESRLHRLLLVSQYTFNLPLLYVAWPLIS
jgi:hypothetical protein